ncbi:phosphomannomutase [Magnetococcus marinus MC-1]|uniref:Phosphomannomutase n=1 Tax=Magnetococcus marinus (strain ATCC BAA-1437 / JCM 17883 / MC-1) TaxID=156889 RepID=A0L4G5_MAGMM|nr:phosphomannomutase/phosphoglucomutase [Magnetococcus marinus]ABK42858.1 phosphomannomutase [Magnetococcus marinus MC-1]
MTFAPSHMFREYDVRGIAHSELSEEVVKHWGALFAERIRDAYKGKKFMPHVVVGRDGRLSSPALANALMAGLAEAGARVSDVGLLPTPGLYYASHALHADGAIMVTGSHNPAEYNGMKMMLGGLSFFGQDIQDLAQRLMLGERPMPRMGGSVSRVELRRDYINRLVADYRPGRPLKVVLDCGNGAAGAVAKELLQALPGIEGEVLFAEVDGTFPNHHPDPTVPANLEDLKNRVLAWGADLGIAFDGDGDRIGAIDGDGRVIWGDRLMILFAREILAEHPGASILGDVKCSQQLFDAVAEAGGKPIMWKTGHSLVKSKMRQSGALLAGEMSGHLFFADRYYGYDDALYAAVRLISLLAAEPTSLAARLSSLPKVYATPELRIECADSRKFRVMDRIKRQVLDGGLGEVSDLDGVRVKQPGGWWLVRVSNTQPALVARVEADSLERLQEMATALAKMLEGENVVFPEWQLV